jgi:hypothetical protein
MPSKKIVNTGSFNQFIASCGQVSIGEANRYADIGSKIINIAMTTPDRQAFMARMLELESELARSIKPPNPKYSISNMASCLLYAQTRDNFNANQGYGKGANINQYGNPETSKTTVGNLMAYFSQQIANKECGYNAKSTHGRWRSGSLPADIKDWKLRIDIESNPAMGSIPAPLKGIHTAHLVPGVDTSGHTKLLVKPENWGMSKPLHIFLHLFDFILTRFTSQHIKGLQGRQETKLTKETAVEQEFNSMKAELNSLVENLQDKTLKSFCKELIKTLDSAKSEKGFEIPLQTLQNISIKLQKWVDDNPHHQEKSAIEALKESIEDKVSTLQDHQLNKYSSAYQQKSEVRLLYAADGEGVTSRVDNSNAAAMKQQFSALRALRKGAAPEQSEPDVQPNVIPT